MRLSPLSEYGWNEHAGRYVNTTTGRFVSFPVVRNELEGVITASQGNIRNITDSLVRREISIAQWETEMMREIRIVHTAEAAAAKGGWAQMTASDWGWTGSQIKFQYQKLHDFAQEIASGKWPLNGRTRTRADLYAHAGRATFEEMRRRYARLFKGAAEERRILDPTAEHCQDSKDRPGCVELAKKGWQPIGSLPRLGEATCITHDKCHFEFRSAAGEML